MKKECGKLDSNQASIGNQTNALWSMSILDLHYLYHKLAQLLLHSKVAKAEIYLMRGYHNEWLELTYHTGAHPLGNSKAQAGFSNFFRL